MSQIAGLVDFSRQGPPADIGTYVLPSSAVVFPFTFSGTTYYAAIRTGVQGWVLLSYGTVPETVVNAAFTTLGAGARVVLMDATFALQVAGLGFTANEQVLEGQGRGTFIDGDALATGVHTINLSGYDDCVIRNLSVQTEDGGGKTCHCIFIEDGADRFLVEDVWIVDSDADGIHVEGTTIDDGCISHCHVLDADGNGIYATSDQDEVMNLTVTDCFVTGAGVDGIYVFMGMPSDAPIPCRGIIANNVVHGNGQHGINLGLFVDYGLVVADNIVYSNTQYGISCSMAYSATITGNICYGNTHGISCSMASLVTITGNVCHGNSHGMYLDFVDGEVDGNTLSENSQYGLYLVAVIWSIISNNICMYNADNDGIYADGDCHSNIFDSNWISVNGGLGMNMVGGGGMIVGNYFNNNTGINLRVAKNPWVIADNFVGSGGGGIALLADALNTVLTGNNIYAGTDGINLATGCEKCLIEGNFIQHSHLSGIMLTDDNDKNMIIGNYFYNNDRYGIEIATANALDNLVKNNYYYLNTLGPILDNGTDTRLAVVKVQFVHPSNGAAWIDGALTAPSGIDVDINDEAAVAHITLPLELFQVVRVKFWAYSRVAEAANNMLLRLRIYGAASSEAWNTNNIDVANKPSVETGGIAVNDVVHWVIDASDDADLADLIGGDYLEISAIGEAAVAPDIATDALFGAVEIEYV